LGDAGAAAALAGLLFVSISVNQERILELGRMADRGLEALTLLFLVIVVMSLILVPGQPLRLLGGEIAAAGGAVMAVIVALQNAYLRDLDPIYRPRSTQIAWFNRLAVALTALGGIAIVWRNDTTGFYFLPLSILLCFLGVGANAWILLIEIKR
jgi:modulator of FtsH protease